MTSHCILHDQFRTLGGAERVALELARTFDAPIYAMRVKDEVVPDDVDVREVAGRLGKRAMSSHYLVQDAFQMLAWQHQPDIYEYDTVIVNKTNPAWFVPRDTQTVVQYVHSTPRGLYDQFHRHGSGLVTAAIKGVMRTLYGANRVRPDAVAANSELVQRRLELYHGLPRGSERSHVIYPPVDVEDYSREHAPTRDYYLTLGRLRDHKRVDEIISGCSEAGVDLVVAGEGPERERLEEQAERADCDVVFRGYVDEAEKQRLMSEAKAFVMAAENEDFGITPIEAMAAGTPVIAVADGFTKHQVLDGENGHTYLRGGMSYALSNAIGRFEREGVAWSERDIEAFADRFSAERFREEITGLVEAAEAASSVSVPWSETPETRHRTADELLADGGES